MPEFCCICGRLPHPCDDPECVSTTATVQEKLDWLVAENARLRAALSSTPQAAQPEPARPDLLERLTYHALERDDMTLDEALDALASGWKKVHGRTERQLLLQLLDLMASRPAPIASPPASVEPLISRSDADYWLRHRAAILGAIEAAGLRLVSSASDGVVSFALSMISPPAAPVEQDDALRERFETFFSWSRTGRGAQHREKQLLRNSDGTYCDDHTQRHWWTWQQAVASAAPQGGQEAAEPKPRWITDGWKISRRDDGRISILHDSIGFCVTDSNSDSIPAIVLYHLAETLLAAAPSPQGEAS